MQILSDELMFEELKEELVLREQAYAETCELVQCSLATMGHHHSNTSPNQEDLQQIKFELRD